MIFKRHLLLVCAALSAPASAQELDPVPGDKDAPYSIDLLVPAPTSQSDSIAAARCEDEADAARITGEIVVCRTLGEATDGLWAQSDFEQRYAERTQGIRAPEMYSDPTPAMVGITIRAEFGYPPPPIAIIDIRALPEAPDDSDADRLAHGLPAHEIAP